MFSYLRSKVTVKRVILVSISVPVGMAAYQGYQLRQNYNRTLRWKLPTANSGIEKWKNKITNLKDGIRERITQAQQEAMDDDEQGIFEKIKYLLKDIRSKVISRIDFENNNDESASKLNKIKSWMQNILKKKSSVKVDSNTESPNVLAKEKNVVISGAREIVSSSSSSSSSLSTLSTPSTSSQQKKIKLLILGDSLVAGVGCTNTEAPTLVKTIARTLSATLGVDIEWKSAGVIGGTVSDIRSQLLPSLKSEFLNVCEEDKQDTEIIAVVICGLNDWKRMLERFPFGAGPAQFRQELKELLHELQSGVDVPCRVFLPAIPFTCGMTDSKFVFKIRPLSYFVQTIFAGWEYQKAALVDNVKVGGDVTSDASAGTSITREDLNQEQDSRERPLVINDRFSFRFVNMPDIGAAYATPGEGNICSDGVHPSSKGYVWWALHISEAILSSQL